MPTGGPVQQKYNFDLISICFQVSMNRFQVNLKCQQAARYNKKYNFVSISVCVQISMIRFQVDLKCQQAARYNKKYNFVMISGFQVFGDLKFLRI